jgi:hypothetical protein
MPSHVEQKGQCPAKSNLGAIKARRTQETDPSAPPTGFMDR